MRVGALDAMLDTIGEGHSDRTKLADRAEALAGELEAAVDLLALLDRAAAPAATEVSLDLIAREVGRVSVSGRGREVTVRFDEARPDCVIVTDPYVLGPLLALVVAFVDASGVDPLVLRARSSPRPCFVVEREGSADTSSPILTIRVMPWIPPSEEAARRAAQRLGAEIVLLPGHGEITLDSTSDD
jgi:hypothetical protein